MHNSTRSASIFAPRITLFICNLILMENHIRAIHSLYRVHELIKKGRTGTPDEFAQIMQVSRRQLYKMIQTLKNYGASVKYDRALQTFYYTDSFTINLGHLLWINAPAFYAV